MEKILLPRILDHIAHTARKVCGEKENRDKTRNNDDHLQKVRHSHGPHATDHCVEKHNGCTDDHASSHGNHALR